MTVQWFITQLTLCHIGKERSEILFLKHFFQNNVKDTSWAKAKMDEGVQMNRTANQFIRCFCSV